MVGQRIVNPWPLEASGFDPLLLHHKQTTWTPVKRDWGSLGCLLMVLCESGGTVYTADLKSAACNGLTGSSPVSRTKFCLARKVNGGWASWGAS